MENWEIDKLIAEKVLGAIKTPSIWFKYYDKEKLYYHVGGSPSSEEVSLIEYIDREWSQYHFSPSTNIQDAWRVAEKVLESTNRLMISRSMDKYICELEWCNEHYGLSESAPMAICLASLWSVGLNLNGNK